MPAVDNTFSVANQRSQDFLVGTSKAKGIAITGWECKVWVEGDGSNKAKNTVCNVGCR